MWDDKERKREMYTTWCVGVFVARGEKAPSGILTSGMSFPVCEEGRAKNREEKKSLVDSKIMKNMR